MNGFAPMWSQFFDNVFSGSLRYGAIFASGKLDQIVW